MFLRCCVDLGTALDGLYKNDNIFQIYLIHFIIKQEYGGMFMMLSILV